VWGNESKIISFIFPFCNLKSLFFFFLADVHNKKTRSYNMSRIKSKNTKPEMLVRKFLFSKGFRFRLHDKKLPGKPDIVLKKYNTVIFVHGCFWHGHGGCKYFVVPKTRTEWWVNKINRNKEVDKKTLRELKKLGYRVIQIWECDLRSNKMDNTLRDIHAKVY
jgi:DNA mismatch endonuclease, patch repair protein